jgi:general secretion pathway protein A
MDYFTILNLNREPFSNSPDPDYFYHSRQHLDCLQKLELSLHLRRGLNVIIGDVGTGKTTLCRQIIRRFAQRKEMETHLILDPLFKDSSDFLATVAKLLSGKKPSDDTTDWQAKELIKHHLFRKGVDQKKTTILVIDEGQKVPVFCLELLREFLNYETNEYKLLQIVIFAQKEFEDVIRRFPNFADRINLYHHLKPLDLQDTRMMIRFRLEKSSSTPKKLDLFTLPATIAIYRATGGFPRKIINLCHQCVLTMIIQNKSKVGWALVRRCASRVFASENRRRWRVPAAAMAAGALAAAVLWAWHTDIWPPLWRNEASLGPRIAAREAVAVETQTAPAVATARLPSAPPQAPLSAVSGPEAALPEPTSPTAPLPAPSPPLHSTQTESAAVAPAAKAGPPRPPDLLGTLNLRRNETISGLIHKVYGSYSNKNFRSIILANPQIEDPDRVEVGHSVRFPAIPVGVTPLNKESWWVKIAEKSSLQEALDLLRNYPESAPPARLIPYWHPVGGMRFVVILKQLFSSPEAAQSQLRLLPGGLAASGQVLASWGDKNVFFADPYYVNK